MQLPGVWLEELGTRARERMLDVLVVGAGPAGSIAALVLARAGARVLVVDRERFPRDKLCGDTLNPGTVALLASLELDNGPLRAAVPLRGMLLTGGRVSIRTMYRSNQVALAVPRPVFDQWLVDEATRAGARFEGGWVARDALIDMRDSRSIVRGVVLASVSRPERIVRIPALMTIGADGRRSMISRSVGLARPAPSPRRWAYGAYVSGVADLGDVGEMHVDARQYVGVAPLSGGVANICVVNSARMNGMTPSDVVTNAIQSNRRLAPRFARAEIVGDVRVLGPLGVDAAAPGVEGALLAGDAAGFVDPMTGDGVSLAIRGGMLAAAEALRALETGDLVGAVTRLAAKRRQHLASKVRFNRCVRALVESPTAFRLATAAAALLPGAFRRMVQYAGDAA